MIRLRLNPKLRASLIKDAAWTLASREGHIGAVTRERVARQAACSTGSVSHYYDMAELVRSVALRAKREARWGMLREVLPGARYEGIIRLTRDEINAIVDATIVPRKK